MPVSLTVINKPNKQFHFITVKSQGFFNTIQLRYGTLNKMLSCIIFREKSDIAARNGIYVKSFIGTEVVTVFSAPVMILFSKCFYVRLKSIIMFLTI